MSDTPDIFKPGGAASIGHQLVADGANVGAANPLPVTIGGSTGGVVPVKQAPGETFDMTPHAGSTFVVTGITSPDDQVTTFSFTAAAQEQVINLAGAGTAYLIIDTLGAGGLITVKFSQNGSTYGPSVQGTPIRVSTQTYNGPPISSLSAGQTIYRFNTVGIQNMKVTAAVLPTGTAVGSVRVSSNVGMVAVDGPVSTESLQDTQVFSFTDLSTFASTVTDILAIRSSGKLNICRIELFANAATAANIPFKVIQRTAVNTVETGATSMDASAKFDTQDGFQSDTTTAKTYGATAPTLNGTATTLWTDELYVRAAGTPGPVQKTVITFGSEYWKSVKRRNPEQFSVSFNGISSASLPAALKISGNIVVTSGT
jgi:hypothetical protein